MIWRHWEQGRYAERGALEARREKEKCCIHTERQTSKKHGGIETHRKTHLMNDSTAVNHDIRCDTMMFTCTTQYNLLITTILVHM